MEFIQEQCLVAVLKDGQVLELDEVYRDVVLVDEETSEQHERNDEHGRESDSQLLVAEHRTDNEGVAAGRIVNQEQDDHYRSRKVRHEILRSALYLRNMGNLYHSMVEKPMA